MIVQLAGLPGTGKSSLAAELVHRLGGRALLLDKDRVRHALFGRLAPAPTPRLRRHPRRSHLLARLSGHQVRRFATRAR